TGMNKFAERCGYASSSIADALVYTLICTFMMFFLTDIVGIKPAAAGVITAVGTIWDAVVNPFVGYLADRVRTSRGRRRPVILISGAFMCFMVFVLFTKVGLPDGIREVYYGCMLMLYWTFYTGFFVPNTALAVLYSTDYNERTILRFFASVFNMFGSIVAMLIPTRFVDHLTAGGMTEGHAWSLMGAVAGLTAFITIAVTYAASKEKDPPCSRDDEEQGERLDVRRLVADYIQVAKLKPMKYLVAASIFSLITYTMVMSDMVYFFTYNMGFDSTESAIFLSLRAVFSIFIIPAIAWVMVRIDKRGAMILFNAFAIAGMILLRATGVSGLPLTLVYMVMVALCTCVYWALMPSIYYDICDYDRVTNGTDRQGMIISFAGLVEAFSSGMGTLILGLILQNSGFDGTAAVQTEHAEQWIFNCATVIPVIFLAIASIAIYKYPITRKVYLKIIENSGKRMNEEDALWKQQ
nr:MFS transporter [Clostridia bacterium]